MDTSPIPGYITRKQAADRCERAERTLQRYWSKAIEFQDLAILSHLKLRAEDGEIIDGSVVTKHRIDDLRAAGKNPTWFAEEEWAVETYGPRSADELGPTPGGHADAPMPEEGTAASAKPALVEALRNENAELRRDKERLYEELKIKNDQIKEANDRTRESNTLMRDLQKMLGNWQDQAFKTLPARTLTGDAEIIPETRTASSEQGSHADAATRVPKIRKQPPVKKRASDQRGKAKWYEMPTFKRILSRSS